jgi:hypothetical protein
LNLWSSRVVVEVVTITVAEVEELEAIGHRLLVNRLVVVRLPNLRLILLQALCTHVPSVLVVLQGLMRRARTVVTLYSQPSHQLVVVVVVTVTVLLVLD